MTPETKQAIDLAARRAADAAVKRTLISLGIDATSARGIRETQQNMAWLGRMRRTTDGRAAKLFIIGFSTVMSIIGAAAATLIQHWVGK